MPIADDVAALASVIGRRPLADCPYINNDATTVRNRYTAYVQAMGNPLNPHAPRPIALQGALGSALPKRYENHSDELGYIEVIRDTGSPHVCPMCGAPKPTTIDHVFPQDPFKDLAIFSRNLVPACSECNRGRQNRYKGNLPGERVLHPYFDAILAQRVARACIVAVNGNYRTPSIDIEVIVNPADPYYPAVRYHIENVVKPAGVIQSLNALWINLQRVPNQNRLPHVFFQTLPLGNFTNAEFDQAVDTALLLADDEFHTPNNWKSMLFSGLANNLQAKQFLAGTIRDLRVRPQDAEDI